MNLINSLAVDSLNQIIGPSYDLNGNLTRPGFVYEVINKNTNPFDGPVDEEIYVRDAEGNIIPVPQGHQMGGSKDGKNEPTGVRKDGKGHPEGPKYSDPRAWKPHGHRPGITNPDETPWLPIY